MTTAQDHLLPAPGGTSTSAADACAAPAPRPALYPPPKPPSTVSMRRPWRMVVSAHVSANDRKPASFPATAARPFSRSRVERTRQSSRVTISPSLASSAGNAAGFGELAHLGVNALAASGYRGILVDHGGTICTG